MCLCGCERVERPTASRVLAPEAGIFLFARLVIDLQSASVSVLRSQNSFAPVQHLDDHRSTDFYVTSAAGCCINSRNCAISESKADRNDRSAGCATKPGTILNSPSLLEMLTHPIICSRHRMGRA